MARLLYSLEDYFDALARDRKGRWSGLMSRVLGGLCALSGDVLKPRSGAVGRHR